MKKLIILILIMMICYFILFLLDDSFVANPVSPVTTSLEQTGSPSDNFNANSKSPKTTSPSQQTLPSESQKPKSPGEGKTIRHAQITNLEIGTDSNGTWFWKVTIENTGPAMLSDCYLTAQFGSSIFFASQNTWKAASGTLVSQEIPAPNQTAGVKDFWSRRYLTDQLKVELRDKVTNAILDTKTVSNLIYSTASMRTLDVYVKRIE